MKLRKENFKKEGVEGDMLYTYTCNDTDFKMGVWGKDKSDRTIYVWKGDEDKKQFTDVLEAWNYFEGLLKECEPEQQSSGGYMRNPQQNPDIMPLLAVKGGKITFFVVTNDGKQVSLLDLDVKNSGIPSPVTDKPFIVDWSNENVEELFKCEIIMKKTDVVFEEDSEADVFLFIPKSIVSQGGQEGGGTQEEGEQKEGQGKEGEGEPKEKGSGAAQDEGGESEEKGEEEEGKGKGEGESEGEGEGEGGDEESEEGEEGEGGKGGEEEGEGEGKQQTQPTEPPQSGELEKDSSSGFGGAATKGNFSDLIKNLSQCTNTPINILVSTFRNVELGEVFLASLNFSNIKQCMGLPNDATPRQLSQLIINSK